ncbi:MAG: NADH-quinone oxidoreductase subunit C [Lysobacteraceae bacterium]|uniref:NADH-quinone oxidoreductase subunit C n=1 Tax=Denitratimonas sp. CY0512 TaxID=3131940 RepID=UPI00169D8AAA|nr:NADH-quinone oxidoreductase subunit C [Gammaproteobacteria bacterium]
MAEPENTLAQRLQARFGDRIVECIEHTYAHAHGEVTLVVAPDRLLEVARVLRDEPEFGFEQLTDLCGIDYLGYGQVEWDTEDATSEGYSRGVEGLGPGRFDWDSRPRPDRQAKRFASVVHLLSIRNNQRLRLRTYAGDDALPVIPSLVDVWPGVNWFEREAFDLFGIVYEGHPDLRRILTDYGFVGHPFRKDFPLIGNVEVRYDAEQERVIYQPVTIEPRVLVPRVLRQDSRREQAEAEIANAAAGK